MATDFGKRLAAAREHAKLTQEALARKVGMAQSTLAAAETKGAGSRKTTQLAAACGVNANWLASGEGPMLSSPGAEDEKATYIVQPHNAAVEPIQKLRRLLSAHTSSRQRTISDVLARFAQDPDNLELAHELSLLLDPTERTEF